MISAKEWEILSFFAVEPTLLDANIPWCYNTATYVVSIAEFTVRCKIVPGCHGFDLQIQRNGKPFLEIQVKDTKDIQFTQIKSTETLTVVVTDESEFELVLRPELCLRQTMRGSL